MVISPKVRGFICTTAHPEGCEQNVRKQIDFVTEKGHIEGPKKVLVLGASTGYGLASRIVATFGCGASTIGVFFEKPASGNKTASAGWYNTAAFEKLAHEAGYYAKSINGDAFSNEIKEQVIDLIKKDLGQVDMVVYSLAAPRRTDPNTGETYNSVIKPIGAAYTSKSVNFHTGEVSDVTVEPANEDEIRQTVAVMGGDDWEMWINALSDAGVLAKGAITVAYSYVGPKMTHSIYRDGTIGRAKDHLESTALKLDEKLQKEIGGRAFVSINKALITQASAAIPVIPLYISILFKVMKEKNVHEGCIEQMYRLFKDRLYADKIQLDEKGRIRIDDLEMREDVQNEVARIWNMVDSENIDELTDIKAYRTDFYNLFGFEVPEVDYTKDVNPEVPIPSIG